MAIVYIENMEIDDSGYPCSCGHCGECGRNFVPTDQEIRDWSVEDGIEHWPYEKRKKHYSGS